MLIKEVIKRRDTLKNYLHSLSIASNYCKIQIGDKQMVDDLQALYKEMEKEFNEINDSLKPFEEMSM